MVLGFTKLAFKNFHAVSDVNGCPADRCDQIVALERKRQLLGRVDGFDQDEAEGERDERAVILRRLFAPKGDTLEALELADRLFNACSRLVECFREESGDVFSVGSIRDCRAYSALPCSLAV